MRKSKSNRVANLSDAGLLDELVAELARRRAAKAAGDMRSLEIDAEATKREIGELQL